MGKLPAVNQGPPLVTCLCLTRNRREWLPLAIKYFQDSTYPLRELLILSSGESVFDLVPEDPSIRLIEIEDGRKIGELRNLGVQLSLGSLIAHWDDDDYSAPDRLADQVTRLKFDKSVTGYSSMRFTDGKNYWEFAGLSDYAIGTSLLYRRAWAIAHPFKDVHIGEDGSFADDARAHEQLICAPAGDLMAASIHPGNTSPRQLKGDNWRLLPAAEVAAAVSA